LGVGRAATPRRTAAELETMSTIPARFDIEPPAFTVGRDDAVPRLGGYAPPLFYRMLANKHREAYWAILVRIFQRKFQAATIALTRPDAIGIAERVLDDAGSIGINPKDIEWEEGWQLPDIEDDQPSGGPNREPARRLIRVLAEAGWVYFQTYPEERYPVLELTRVGQVQIGHMLRDMQGKQLPLVSFADRLGELVGNNCSAMRTTAGRLKQLRDVVGQLNERIAELLAGIKSQSEGAIIRTRSIRAILVDLLVEFERRVGYEYSVMKRKESPPRLWAAVTQAVWDLRSDPIWLHREAEWYREQFHPDNMDAAIREIEEDLNWISQVMDNLSSANELLDRRYSRYVNNAKRRIEAQLRQAFNMADGLAALLEAAAAGKTDLRPVRVARVVGIGPVGFTVARQQRTATARSAVPDVQDMTEDEASGYRKAMDDSVPVGEVRRWMGIVEGMTGVIDVDDLPLVDQEDYLRHLFAGFYAGQPKYGMTFQPSSCSGTLPCPTPKTCTVCTRRANGFSVPRGRFIIASARSKT
jgi:hypothetical protein